MYVYLYYNIYIHIIPFFFGFSLSIKTQYKRATRIKHPCCLLAHKMTRYYDYYYFVFLLSFFLFNKKQSPAPTTDIEQTCIEWTEIERLMMKNDKNNKEIRENRLKTNTFVETDQNDRVRRNIRKNVVFVGFGIDASSGLCGGTGKCQIVKKCVCERSFEPALYG